MESMISEEQEHVPFPFDDDTESMNSDEEAEQWTNLKKRQAVALGRDTTYSHNWGAFCSDWDGD